MGQNKWGEDVIVHTGLMAIDITQLDDYAVENHLPLDDDPFADLVIEAPNVPRKAGRPRTKRREAGDGKGPLSKLRKP